MCLTAAISASDASFGGSAVDYGRGMAATKKLYAALKRPGPHRVLRGDLSFAGLPGVVYTPESGINLPGVAFGHEWVTGVGLCREDYGTHSLRRTKASIIYKATGNLRAVQILLGHSKIENTVRYLGVDVEDALTLAEGAEI